PSHMHSWPRRSQRTWSALHALAIIVCTTTRAVTSEPTPELAGVGRLTAEVGLGDLGLGIRAPAGGRLPRVGDLDDLRPDRIRELIEHVLDRLLVRLPRFLIGYRSGYLDRHALDPAVV